LYCNQLKKEKKKVFLSSKYEKKMISKNLFFFLGFFNLFFEGGINYFFKKNFKISFWV